MVKKRRGTRRRAFLAMAGLAGMGGLGMVWAGTSSSWVARFMRERYAELGRAVPPAAHRPDPSAWSDEAITLAWLGHATVLVNFYGVRVLVDPTFYGRVGVGLGVGTLGPQRWVGCALEPAKMPDVDVVLVTHAHFDHLDIPSLRAVKGRPVAVMAWETSDLLPRRAYAAVHELGWDEVIVLKPARGEIRVRGLEVEHWGARVRRDTHRGYAGFVVEREGRRLLFGGDTADTPVFAGHRRHGPYEAAIMPIGAYDPWIRAHCTPEQAVAMADAAGARLFVPIHHQTFKLSNEPMDEPLARAEAALVSEAGRLVVREVGETVVLVG
jgi:L-ascorbate metabolism protein UlaG (beta-lactamase superfamily)